MSDDLVVGAIFAGRYRIEHRIAAGGMGAVYEVLHLETNRRRALKVMHPDFVQNEESRDRFRQEARVAAEVSSDYIVDVFDAGVDESTRMPYLVMELLEGEEISKRIRRLGRLPAQDAVLFLHQAALALDKTHRARIVHRDLKPDNLFLCEREDGPPRVKVLDFGIAKIVAENAASASATQAVGTPLYMAPEQFLADSKVSPATDLYALAMIAYTMLVGQTYWLEESKKGANVFAFAAYATLGPQEAATVRAERSGVTLSPGFDAWFAKASSKKPEDRYTSATSMIAALAEALGLPAPAALMAGSYAQGAGQTAGASGDGDRNSLPPGGSTASLIGSARTTPAPQEQKRSMLVLGGGAVGACIVITLLYVVLSSSGSNNTSATQPVAADSAASSANVPAVTPAPSATIAPPAVPTAPVASASAAPKASSTSSAPKVQGPVTKKGRWVRD